MKLLKSRRAGDSGVSDPPSEEAAVSAPNSDTEDSDRPISPQNAKSRFGLSKRIIADRVLPGLALLLAMVAGFLRWHVDSTRSIDSGGADAVRAASEGTAALLSYSADSVQKDLDSAKGRLTGGFLDAYTKLTNDVVIPGAQQKHVSAVATVPAAAITSATADHAVVMLFVDQTVTMGKDAPTQSASSVRVALDKVGDRWLISQFDPV